MSSHQIMTNDNMKVIIKPFFQLLDDLSLSIIIEFIPVHYFLKFSLTCKRMYEMLCDEKKRVSNRFKEMKELLFSIKKHQKYLEIFNQLFKLSYLQKRSYDLIIYILRNNNYLFKNLNISLRGNEDIIFTVFTKSYNLGYYMLTCITNKEIFKNYNFIKGYYEINKNYDKHILSFIPKECFDLTTEKGLQFTQLCVQYEGSKVFHLIDSSFLKDKEFILNACKINGNFNLTKINNELKDDFNFMLELTNYSNCFKIASDRLKNKRKFVEKCMKRDLNIFNYTSESFQIENKDLIMNIIQKQYYNVKELCNTLQNDKELILLAIKNNLIILDEISNELRKDLYFVKNIINYNYRNIKYLNENELTNLDIIVTIVNVISKTKNLDKEIIIHLFNSNINLNLLQQIIVKKPNYAKFLKDEQLNLFNIKVLKNVILKMEGLKQLFTNNNKMLELIDLILEDKIKKNLNLLFNYFKNMNITIDKERMKNLILIYPANLQIFYKYFLQQNDLEELIILNPSILNQMKKLKYFNKICLDKIFITKIVTLNNNCFKFLPKKFRDLSKNKQFILEIINKCPSFKNYVRGQMISVKNDQTLQ